MKRIELNHEQQLEALRYSIMAARGSQKKMLARKQPRLAKVCGIMLDTMLDEYIRLSAPSTAKVERISAKP